MNRHKKVALFAYVFSVALTCGLGCTPQGPMLKASTVYEELELPQEVGQDLGIRILRKGEKGEEAIRCVDITFGDKNCRLYVGSAPLYRVAVAEKKQVKCEQRIQTVKICEHYGFKNPDPWPHRGKPQRDSSGSP